MLKQWLLTTEHLKDGGNGLIVNELGIYFLK